MSRQKKVGVGSIQDRIEHVFTYKGMEDLDLSKVLDLLKTVCAFTVANGPRIRAERMASVLGVPGLSHTRLPLHLSQTKLLTYSNRVGWCCPPEVHEYLKSLESTDAG
jgi:hypothetical protein